MTFLNLSTDEEALTELCSVPGEPEWTHSQRIWRTARILSHDLRRCNKLVFITTPFSDLQTKDSYERLEYKNRKVAATLPGIDLTDQKQIEVDKADEQA